MRTSPGAFAFGFGIVTLVGLVSRAPSQTPSSSDWLSLLPDGPTKRQFILDCTGCHQFDGPRALKDGRPRSEAEWKEATARMLGFAGPNTGFPVISSAQNADSTAAWLVRNLGARTPRARSGDSASPRVTEFLFPVGEDLPHDLAVDSSGNVVVTGMFSDAMYTLIPGIGSWQRTAIPVENANPRSLDIDGRGRWWVVLGAPGKVGRFEGREWTFYDIGLYAHSVALGPNGTVYANGHFTRDPEQIVEVTADGVVRAHDLTRHPELATRPGGPIPYEIRTAPDGRVWMSELVGNRIVVLDPATGASEAFTLPTPHSGPRRFDVDAHGVLWIPAYGAGLLVRFDPGTRRFEEIALPIKDAAPYVARVDARSGLVWIGTGAADAVFSYDPATRRFSTFHLPSHGALVRHLDIDPRTGDVWLAYGESPGKIPARIARLRTR